MIPETCTRCGLPLFSDLDKISFDQYEARLASGTHQDCDMADFDDESHAHDFDTHGVDTGSFA